MNEKYRKIREYIEFFDRECREFEGDCNTLLTDSPVVEHFGVLHEHIMDVLELTEYQKDIVGEYIWCGLDFTGFKSIDELMEHLIKFDSVEDVHVGVVAE